MGTISKEKIKVNQTLHGYSEGHRLLESSIDLPRGAEHAMLIMSDMSGPSMAPGFETYITGYPIDEPELFALGRTWYAPEMDRPGCVWTHTLLIGRNDLGLVKDLGIFLRLFYRPSFDGTRSHYGSYLEVPTSRITDLPMQDNNVSPNIASRFIEALYSKPDLPIYITSQDSKKYESFIFAIWSQQWPGLRESFYFCTGSIANRKINGKSLDIQVIPEFSLSKVKREVPNGIILVEADFDNSTPRVPNWVDVITSDLFQYPKGRFRQFLWDFGTEVAGGRSAFTNLTKAYLCTEEVNAGRVPLSSLTSTLGQLFPSPEEAVSLKIGLFLEAVAGKEERLIPNVNGSQLLAELLTSRYHNAFASKYLDIQELAKKYWDDHRAEAKELLFKLVDSELNPLGEEFLTGISKAINTYDAFVLSRERPELMYVFVNRNPYLAAAPELWGWSIDKEREIFDAVIRCPNIPKDLRRGIVQAMLRAGINTIASDVVKHFKEDAIMAVLEWYDANIGLTFAELAGQWQDALKARPSALLKWVEESNAPRIDTMALIIKLLDPNSSIVLNYGANIWLNLAKTATSALGETELAELMSFILSIGFNNPGEGSEELVARSFEIVHDAAARNQLDYRSWQILERQIPSLTWWRDWDRCERLRRALIDRFMRYDWPAEHFLRTVRNRETLQKIVDYCNSTDQGRLFLRKLRNQVVHGKISTTDDQANILLMLKDILAPR